MYRHQQQISAPSGHLPTHSWFNPGYYHSAHAQLATTPATSYNVQEPQIYMHMGYPQNCIQRDLPDFVHNELPTLQSTQKQVDAGSIFPPPPPPVPVGVKREMCSPGGQWDGVSSLQTQCLENRPLQAGSPYECEEKTPFQTQANPDIPGGKTRTKDKYRVVYTDHQRTELEREYTYHNRYITIKRKSELAANLGLSERQIKIWFQNRRAKERKQTKKLQSQEEPRMWNNHPTHPNGAQYDYQDFVHNKIPPLQPQGQRVGVEGVLPSPPISDSGSELCCPGGERISP